MAQAAFMAAGGLTQALGRFAENASITEAAEARGTELARQAKRTGELAAEKRSDAAREGDRLFGAMLAAQADTGATVGSLSRFAGEIGGTTGLNKGRITSNQLETVGALRAESKAVGKEAHSKIVVKSLEFFGKQATQFAGAFGGKPDPVDEVLSRRRTGVGPSGGGEG